MYSWNLRHAVDTKSSSALASNGLTADLNVAT